MCIYRNSFGVNLCGEKYQGETDRPLSNRRVEHIRAAKNPQSYPENALGYHYHSVHPIPNCQVDISVLILDIQRNTLKHKLSEALYMQRKGWRGGEITTPNL